MAIDTAAKRAAALGAGFPPGVVLPIPDGAIDAQDRAQLSGTTLPAAATSFIGPDLGSLNLFVSVAMNARDFSSRFSAPGAMTYSIVGTLPTGLTLSSAGVLSGTPSGLGQSQNVVVRANDGTTTADSNSFTITIVAATARAGSVGSRYVGVVDVGSIDVGSLEVAA